MKTILRNSALVLLLALMLSSCNTERRALGQMRTLTNHVEMRAADYENDDWKEAFEHYKKIDAQIGKGEKLTPEEQKEYGELKARCLKSFAKSKVESITSTLRGYLNQGLGFLRGLLD